MKLSQFPKVSPILHNSKRLEVDGSYSIMDIDSIRNGKVEAMNTGLAVMLLDSPDAELKLQPN